MGEADLRESSKEDLKRGVGIKTKVQEKSFISRYFLIASKGDLAGRTELRKLFGGNRTGGVKEKKVAS